MPFLRSDSSYILLSIQNEIVLDENSVAAMLKCRIVDENVDVAGSLGFDKESFSLDKLMDAIEGVIHTVFQPLQNSSTSRSQ